MDYIMGEKLNSEVLSKHHHYSNRYRVITKFKIYLSQISLMCRAMYTGYKHGANN